MKIVCSRIPGKGVVTSEGSGGTSAGGSVAGSKHKRGRNCKDHQYMIPELPT